MNDDLFHSDWLERNRYPQVAGHQGGETDREAATLIEESGRAATLRAQVLEIYAASPEGLTADEAAHLLDENILAIRPRVTELKIRGALFDTGLRRQTALSRSQRVMKHVLFAESDSTKPVHA